jgi:hypothetical protein
MVRRAYVVTSMVGVTCLRVNKVEHRKFAGYVLSGLLRLSYPGESDEVSQSRPASDLGQSPKSPLTSLLFLGVTVAI